MDQGLIALVITIVLLVADFAIRVLAIIFVPRNRRPQTAMAWLLAIFFIPYLGILLFLLFGRAQLPKARRLKQVEKRVGDVTPGGNASSDG